MVRLKDICTMTKEKTARLIPNAIQLCTDNEKVSSSFEQTKQRRLLSLCITLF